MRKGQLIGGKKGLEKETDKKKVARTTRMVADDRKSQSVGQLLLKHCITTSCSTLGFRSNRKGFSLLLCLGDAQTGADWRPQTTVN